MHMVDLDPQEESAIRQVAELLAEGVRKCL
jgi:hypothetical protein